MNGDHAEDQKKTFRLMGEWKDKATYQSLGEQELLSMLETSWDTLHPILEDAMAAKVERAGGLQRWESLTPAEQATHDISAMQDLSVRLGKTVFEKLPDSVRASLKLLIWAGCSMHKELNSVKGGDRAMQAAWATLELEPPILLANKDNAATLQLGNVASATDIITAAEQHAFKTSARGGVKATSLAGALFNHKDDKKGQQDTHRNYMRQITGKPYMFPDTSNTRYQTYCDAAAELLINLEHYITFLEMIRDKKEKHNFNHMEANVYKALHDSATLTELAVLVLYAQAVTHPYMCVVQGPGTEQVNILDLGPLHQEVKAHIKILMEDPQLLLSPHTSYKTGAMDGQPWENPDAIAAVQRHSWRLVHLEKIFILFLGGTLSTWEWFTAEFAPGGLIDTATATDRENAWMPSTNDANEGALGSYRLAKRFKPRLTQHAYNAQAKYSRNDTEAFMLAKLTPEDHTFLYAKARILDRSRLEERNRQAQVVFDQRIVDMKRQRNVERQAKLDAESERLSKIHLIMDEAVIAEMKNAELEEQLECLRQWDVMEAGAKQGLLLRKTHFKQMKRDERRAYLKTMVTEFSARFSLQNGILHTGREDNAETSAAMADDWGSDDEGLDD